MVEITYKSKVNIPEFMTKKKQQLLFATSAVVLEVGSVRYYLFLRKSYFWLMSREALFIRGNGKLPIVTTS